MSIRTRNLFIKIAAYISLLAGIVFGLSLLMFVISISINNQDLNMGKLYLLDLIIILAATAIFLLFFGLFEFLLSFQKIGQEVENLEQEVKVLEGNGEGQDNV